MAFCYLLRQTDCPLATCFPTCCQQNTHLLFEIKRFLKKCSSRMLITSAHVSITLTKEKSEHCVFLVFRGQTQPVVLLREAEAISSKAGVTLLRSGLSPGPRKHSLGIL